MSGSDQDLRLALAARLRAARERAGLSQGQVARLLEMHRPTITEVEAGNRRVLAEELPRFADLYDVSVDWLLGRVRDEDVIVRLAARGLDKLKPADRQKLQALLASLPDGDG